MREAGYLQARLFLNGRLVVHGADPDPEATWQILGCHVPACVQYLGHLGRFAQASPIMSRMCVSSASRSNGLSR
jgi:hypothetical protein